ncbi:MAG: FtsQ-type POTRA domain-containing protein [Verrucomicrobiota bacterium]|nr:FtsQ-type POTRA domain-containing protein [Verrucomicrobiota bacterium]
MSAKRIAHNQRASKPRQRKQQHLLDVTVRRDIAKEQRNRAVFGFIFRVILVGSLCSSAWFGGNELLRRFLWENPDYFLTDIRVVTDGALTREQILGAAQVLAGCNIFSVDLARVRSALDELPQVERAAVQRVLPNRIDISISERKPIAWVTQEPDEDPTTSEKSFLIDGRGVVMRTRTLLPEFLHLPVIWGVETGNLVAGQKVRSFEMKAALELVGWSADNVRFQARSLDLSKGYCVVVTDQARRKITFGLDRVEEQLERLLRLLDHVESTQREIHTVNLRVERNTPVTFVEPPEVAAADLPAPSGAGRTEPGQGKPAGETKSSTPAPVRKPQVHSSAPSSSAKKEPTPASRKKTPAEPLKKPFRLNQNG